MVFFGHQAIPAKLWRVLDKLVSPFQLEYIQNNFMDIFLKILIYTHIVKLIIICNENNNIFVFSDCKKYIIA